MNPEKRDRLLEAASVIDLDALVVVAEGLVSDMPWTYVKEYTIEEGDASVTFDYTSYEKDGSTVEDAAVILKDRETDEIVFSVVFKPDEDLKYELQPEHIVDTLEIAAELIGSPKTSPFEKDLIRQSLAAVFREIEFDPNIDLAEILSSAFIAQRVHDHNPGMMFAVIAKRVQSAATSTNVESCKDFEVDGKEVSITVNRLVAAPGYGEYIMPDMPWMEVELDDLLTGLRYYFKRYRDGSNGMQVDDLEDLKKHEGQHWVEDVELTEEVLSENTAPEEDEPPKKPHVQFMLNTLLELEMENLSKL